VADGKPAAEPVRAVFFDLDGTLYDRDALLQSVVSAQFEAFRHDLAGVDKTAFVERVFTLDAHGYGDKSALYAEIIGERGLPVSLADHLERGFWTRYVASCDATPDTIDTLGVLKEHGFKLGVITNGGARIQAARLASLGLADSFDGAKAAGMLPIWKRVAYWHMTDPMVPRSSPCRRSCRSASHQVPSHRR
jgi:putative hydrolase of the HAD superfamily